MNDPIQPEKSARAETEAETGRAGVYETHADESTGSNAVNTYERPAAAVRSGPNLVAILLLLVILALLAYAAFQLIR